MQSSLPAGWLAFTGRELNPLDRYERFQITFSFPFPEFFLAQRTAGFPQYGWKAGVSGETFPARHSEVRPNWRDRSKLQEHSIAKANCFVNAKAI
jgi:hypothetical protein